VEHFPVFSLGPSKAVGGINWEHGDIAYTPQSGGTVTTNYGANGHPIGADICDDRGVVIMRIVRQYDDGGRIAADELISEEVDRPLPKELPNEFNDAQRKAISNFMNRAFGTRKSTYKYDDRGRVIEKHITGGALDDQVTRIRYNDHGDVTDEVAIHTPTPEMLMEFSLDDAGAMIPKGPPRDSPPTHSELRYEYEYDAQGNWTKKITAWRSEPNAELRESAIERRTITYY
jgi:hypothetical protein